MFLSRFSLLSLNGYVHFVFPPQESAQSACFHPSGTVVAVGTHTGRYWNPVRQDLIGIGIGISPNMTQQCFNYQRQQRNNNTN